MPPEEKIADEPVSNRNANAPAESFGDEKASDKASEDKSERDSAKEELLSDVKKEDRAVVETPVLSSISRLKELGIDLTKAAAGAENISIKSKEEEGPNKNLQEEKTKETSSKEIDSKEIKTKEINPKEAEAKELKTSDGDQRERLNYLQDNLKNLLPEIVPLQQDYEKYKDPETRLKAAQEEKQKLIKEWEGQLKEERAEGIFGSGSTTQKAMQAYLDWIEKRVVPQVVESSDKLGVQLLPDGPFNLRPGDIDVPIAPDTYKALILSGEQKANVGIDATALPSENDLDKFDKSFIWVQDMAERLKTVEMQNNEAHLKGQMNENDVPKDWFRKEDESLQDWLPGAARDVRLLVETRNYIEAMVSLHKASRGQDAIEYTANAFKSEDRKFQINLPPGTELTFNYKGEDYKVDQTNINSKELKDVIEFGSIKSTSIDLPQDHTDSPESAAIRNKLVDWLNTNSPKVDQAVAAAHTAQGDKNSILLYADQPVENGLARFDKDGNFIALANKKTYEPVEGESTKDSNLMAYDFTVTEIKEGPNKGKFEIIQTVQPNYAPITAAYDMRMPGIGVKALGPKTELDRKLVEAEDWIPVRDGNEVKLVMAKNAESFRSSQEWSYYGNKAMLAGMDIAMLAGGIAVTSATLGSAGPGALSASLAARTAARGTAAAAIDYASEGAGLAGRQLLFEAAKSSARASVGALGVAFHSTAGQQLKWGDSPVGKYVNEGLTVFYMADIAHSLGHGGYKKLTSLLGKESPASAAEIIESVVLPTKPLANMIHKNSGRAFVGLGLPMGAQIYGEWEHTLIEDREGPQRSALSDAINQRGDGHKITDKKQEDSAASSSEQTELAIKDITPEFMKALADENPELAGRLRTQLIESIQPPTSKSQAEKLIENISVISKLATSEGGAFTAALSDRLNSLIDKESESFASLYPDLRAKAAETIPKISLGNGKVYEALSAEGTIQLDGKTINTGESSAKVRLAAINSLAEKNDYWFRSSIPSLLSKETDPVVAARLRELDDSVGNNEIRADLLETALTSAINTLDKYPHLRSFDRQAAEQWVNARFDLLDNKNFRTALLDHHNSEAGIMERAFGNPEPQHFSERGSGNEHPILAQRKLQFERLQEESKGKGVDADRAKMALFYIATTNGSIMSNDTGAIEIPEAAITVETADWKSAAARALVEGAEEGSSSRDLDSMLIREGIKTAQGSAKQELLKASVKSPNQVAETLNNESTHELNSSENKQSNIENWMKDCFPLLDRQTFNSTLDSKVGGATTWLERRLHSDVYLTREEKRAAEQTLRDRECQFNDLVEMAKGASSDSTKARAALYHIAITSGANLGDGHDAIALTGKYLQEEQADKKWPERAAETLAKLVDAGPVKDEQLSIMISQGALTAQDSEARIKFLEGFNLIYGSNFEQASEKYLALALNELDRPEALQSHQFQQELMRSLAKVDEKISIPIISVFQAKSSSKEVRLAAAKHLFEIAKSKIAKK